LESGNAGPEMHVDKSDGYALLVMLARFHKTYQLLLNKLSHRFAEMGGFSAKQVLLPPNKWALKSKPPASKVSVFPHLPLPAIASNKEVVVLLLHCGAGPETL